jgi:hypothetical protein
MVTGAAYFISHNGLHVENALRRQKCDGPLNITLNSPLYGSMHVDVGMETDGRGRPAPYVHILLLGDITTPERMAEELGESTLFFPNLQSGRITLGLEYNVSGGTLSTRLTRRVCDEAGNTLIDFEPDNIPSDLLEAIAVRNFLYRPQIWLDDMIA